MVVEGTTDIEPLIPTTLTRGSSYQGSKNETGEAGAKWENKPENWASDQLSSDGSAVLHKLYLTTCTRYRNTSCTRYRWTSCTRYRCTSCTVMVVMSQLYLCDEPYWSRFHSPPGALSQPTVHVISDGKHVSSCIWWMVNNMVNGEYGKYGEKAKWTKVFGWSYLAAFYQAWSLMWSDVTWHVPPCQHGMEHYSNLDHRMQNKK